MAIGARFSGVRRATQGRALLDVRRLSLGIETLGGVFTPSSSAQPPSRPEDPVFSTARTSNAFHIRVFHGEREIGRRQRSSPFRSDGYSAVAARHAANLGDVSTSTPPHRQRVRQGQGADKNTIRIHRPSLVETTSTRWSRMPMRTPPTTRAEESVEAKNHADAWCIRPRRRLPTTVHVGEPERRAIEDPQRSKKPDATMRANHGQTTRLRGS